MPVVTRRQANQMQEEEFSVLRQIQTDYSYNRSYTTSTTSATGCGVHTRWFYPDDPFTTPPHTVGRTSQSDRHSGDPQDESTQEHGPSSQATAASSRASQGFEHSSPKPSSLKTPAQPEPTGPASSTRVVADTDMVFLLRIKKDEDVGEAIERHIGLCRRESEMRQRENQRRVYQFIKSRPELLRDFVEEDTESVVREASVWDRSPFV